MSLSGQADRTKSRLRRFLFLITAGFLAVWAPYRATVHGRFPLFFELTALWVTLAFFWEGLAFTALLLFLFLASASVLVYFGMGFLSVALLAGVWALLIFLLQRGLEMNSRYLESSDRHVEEIRKRLSAIQQTLQRAELANEQAERSLHEFVGIFEATRQMSACLSLSDIVACLGHFIRQTFRFERAFLLIVPRGRGTEEAVFYDLGLEAPSAPEAVLASQVKDEAGRSLPKILERLGEIRQPIQVLDAAAHPLRPALDLPAGWTTFLAIPLRAEGELRAALAVAGLPPADFEKFLVLAEQTALELEKARLYEQVTELAIIDGLTDVFVRRHFMERFAEELVRSERMGFPLSLLLLDIDHFKRHNDEMGHLVGDAVLKEVARLLKRSIREIDLVGRYGGEEFAVLLPDTPREGALQVAERIRAAVDTHVFKAYDESVHVTVSIGVAGFPKDAKTGQGLIDEADRALYGAKEKGRNRVCA